MVQDGVGRGKLAEECSVGRSVMCVHHVGIFIVASQPSRTTGTIFLYVPRRLSTFS